MRHSRRLVLVVLVAVLALGLANVAVAAKKAKGQDLYKEFCKPCHAENSPNGEYTPMTLIQDQWERFFDEEYVASHTGVNDPHHEDKPVTEAISAEDLETIKKWTVDHAADSEHPMTCG
jgi:Spy/CpxP family protein refolding chaperone